MPPIRASPVRSGTSAIEAAPRNLQTLEVPASSIVVTLNESCRWLAPPGLGLRAERRPNDRAQTGVTCAHRAPPGCRFSPYLADGHGHLGHGGEFSHRFGPLSCSWIWPSLQPLSKAIGSARERAIESEPPSARRVSDRQGQSSWGRAPSADCADLVIVPTSPPIAMKRRASRDRRGRHNPRAWHARCGCSTRSSRTVLGGADRRVDEADRA